MFSGFDKIYAEDGDDNGYEDVGLDFSFGMMQIDVGLHLPWRRGRCLDGQNNKNKACRKNQFCQRINQVPDQVEQ